MTEQFNNNRGVHASVPILISVVIVNYNGKHHLERCLPSLAAQTCSSFEVIVVDNASSDGSVEWLRAEHPKVRLFCSPKNIGFAAGNNLGIRAARGEWIATLNSDTEAEPDCLEQLVAPGRDPNVGSIAPLMLEFARRDYIDAAGIRIDRAAFAWNRLAGKHADEATEITEVWGACAGAGLYRRSMLDQIGLFDEDYFGFYEDVDLAWRAHRAGWKCVFAPTARVYHVHGGSFGRSSPSKLYLLARNRWWTLLKNYPMPGLVLNLPVILMMDLISLLISTVRNRSLAPLRGRIDALRSIRKAIDKRRLNER